MLKGASITIPELRQSLAWFHMLEANQVALYKAQAMLADNPIERRVFMKGFKARLNKDTRAKLRMHYWGRRAHAEQKPLRFNVYPYFN